MIKINSNIILLAVIGLTVIGSGCMNSNEPTPIKSFDYSTNLSPEEQKIVGYWNSQSGMTTFVFNTDRTGRRIARADCQNETGNNRDVCIESGGMDNGGIIDNETYNWRIENGKIITEHVYPNSVPIKIDGVIVRWTDAIVGGSWSYYMTNENFSDILTLLDFSGVGKDIRFRKYSTMSFTEFKDAMMSNDLTTLQKENLYVNKTFRWDGQVTDVTQDTVIIEIRKYVNYKTDNVTNYYQKFCAYYNNDIKIRQSCSPTNIRLRVSDDQKSQLNSLSKGSLITFEGTITDRNINSLFSGIDMYNGKIINYI